MLDPLSPPDPTFAGGSAETRKRARTLPSSIQSLWHFQTGDRLHAIPVSFAIDGRQHVAIAADNALLVFGLPAE